MSPECPLGPECLVGLCSAGLDPCMSSNGVSTDLTVKLLSSTLGSRLDDTGFAC